MNLADPVAGRSFLFVHYTAIKNYTNGLRLCINLVVTMVRFQQYKPCAALARYVKSYWILEHSYLPDVPERIIPDGCIELIIHYGDKYISTINGQQDTQPQSIVVGQLTQAIYLQPTGKTGILAIRFYPWGLYSFVGKPVHEFTDRFVSAEDVLGKRFSDVTDKLLNAEAGERIKLVEDYLLSVLARQKAGVLYQADKVAPLLTLMNNNVGNTSVAGMAYSANLSVRQLNRIINQVAGLSPKQLSRIVRLQGFFARYRMAGTATLTSLLYECGYYDQAHFIRDFKSISGISPSEFFEGKNEMAELMLQ